MHCNAYIQLNIEYCVNYSDTSGSLWQFKRDETDNNANINITGGYSFKYDSDLIDDVTADGTVKNKI